MINLQIAKTLNIKFPYLYRYMGTEFIDKFFNDGILRISSFEKFRKYPDEIRGDKREGSGSFKATSGNSNFALHLMTRVGENGYMLSTSLVNSDSIMHEFETNGVFRIKDPISFAAAISNSIVGNNQVHIGFCNYLDHKIIKKTVPELSVNDFTDEEGHMIIGGRKMMERTNQIMNDGSELYFLKDQKYQKQSEFRFVWTINTEYFKMNEYLDVECKEAIQFCEKIEKED